MIPGLLLFNRFPPSGLQTILSEDTRRIQEPLPKAQSTVLTAELGIQLVSKTTITYEVPAIKTGALREQREYAMQTVDEVL